MNIYVDFDDCLCETAKYFTGLAADLFGKDVPYEDLHSFDLQESFGLTQEQYEVLLCKGHEPEVLLAYEETPGASEVINEWVREGADVTIITGRPYSSYNASRMWLDRHGLHHIRLYCMDKYGRETAVNNSDNILSPDEFYRMKFDCAVEDSPSAFRFFDPLPELKVMVFDRPWNRDYKFPNGNYHRCFDWEDIKELTKE